MYSTEMGTLLLRKGADIGNMLHDICWQRRTSKRDQESSVLDNSIGSDTDSISTNGYHNVILDISKRYQNQAKVFKQCFENADLSKINFLSISKSIDPFIWNFHFLVSQSKNEWNTMKSFPGLGVPYFQEKTSCHHNSRVLRTLFSICHTIYQVSNGECANPLHVLLADTVDTYSGSAKLSSTLNSFGIVCSKNKSRDYIDSIVNRKNLSKFIDDLNVNSFTIISIDNIDFGQPNAAVSVSPQNRGIHATSYQAVQPKPSALMDLPRSSVLLHTNAVIDISSVTTSSFTLNDVEKAEAKSLDKCIFQYILEKHSIENSELLIPNLKCQLSKFKEPNTERAKVVYLGVLNEPCDNTETVKHTIEKIHSIFEVSAQNKYMVMVGDAKTNNIFCKLKSEYSEELSWVIPFPGDCHLLKNSS